MSGLGLKREAIFEWRACPRKRSRCATWGGARCGIYGQLGREMYVQWGFDAGAAEASMAAVEEGRGWWFRGTVLRIYVRS
jgi:hypothetical protein